MLNSSGTPRSSDQSPLDKDGSPRRQWSDGADASAPLVDKSDSSKRAKGQDSAAFVPVSTQILWLLVWIANNIGVTLLNKAAFASVEFHYPFTLSAIHMLCSWAGTYIYMGIAGMERKAIDRKNYRILFMFSLVFALNIAIGNVSLKYVSVNFNQVMRSLVPAVVMLSGACLFRKNFSRNRKLAVVPIVLGVALACYGEMSFTPMGFFFTVLCVVLAAMKVVLSGEMLTGDMKLPPLDLLARMAPLALMEILVVAAASGELLEISSRWDELSKGYAWPVVFFSGATSFTLNICSLQANKVTSPLTLTIVANVKQVLLIAVGTVVFQTPISTINAWGIAVVIAGSMRYSYVGYLESSKSAPALPK